MRQLRADERKGGEHRQRLHQQIPAGQVLTALRPPAAQPAGHARAPRQKTDEERHEINRQRGDEPQKPGEAVAVIHAGRAVQHVFAHAHLEKRALRLEQRRHAPARRQRQRDAQAGEGFAQRQAEIIFPECPPQNHSRQRQPRHRPFRQKTQRQRDVKNPPPGLTARCSGPRQFPAAPDGQRGEENHRHVRRRHAADDGDVQSRHKHRAGDERGFIVAGKLPAPAHEEQGGGGGEQNGRQPRGERIFAEDFVTGRLAPVDQDRLVKPPLAVEPRHHVIAALEHLARRLGKPRLVAVGERQNPVAREQQREAQQQNGALRLRGKFFQPG